MTYKESLHRIWLIAKREVHRLVAQPIYFFCMLIAPAICVIFFVSLMHEGLPTDLPIAVVDMDNSATSRNLIRQLDAFEQTEVYMKTMSFTEARHWRGPLWVYRPDKLKDIPKRRSWDSYNRS